MLGYLEYVASDTTLILTHIFVLVEVVLLAIICRNLHKIHKAERRQSKCHS